MEKSKAKNTTCVCGSRSCERLGSRREHKFDKFTRVWQTVKCKSCGKNRVKISDVANAGN